MLAALQRVGVIERAQLALRMVTKLEPSQVRLDIDNRFDYLQIATPGVFDCRCTGFIQECRPGRA